MCGPDSVDPRTIPTITGCLALNGALFEDNNSKTSIPPRFAKQFDQHEFHQHEFHQMFPCITGPNIRPVRDNSLWVMVEGEGRIYDTRNTLFNPLLKLYRPDECQNMFRFTCEPVLEAIQKLYRDKLCSPRNDLCAGGQLFTKIGSFCESFELVRCTNQECYARKQEVLRILPPCEWELRDWMATAVSCWQTERAKAESDTDWKVRTREILETRLGRADWDPESFDLGRSAGSLMECSSLDNATLPARLGNPCFDIVGTFNLLYWYHMTFDNRSSSGRFVRSWPNYHLLYEPLFLREALRLQGLLEVRQTGICPSRFWNLAVEGSESYITVLVALMGVQQGGFEARNPKHSHCTSQSCNFANDNTTNLFQHHKCRRKGNSSPGVDEVKFPMRDIESIFLSSTLSSATWASSAWDLSSLDPPKLNRSPASKYVAISHVWSDGTGVGMKEPGVANRCLVEYFQSIASRLGCDSIWWDAICLPSERSSRRRALDQMLENFQRASFTVIHDMELVNFEWSDNGAPALALMLSPWFTRGWTAAELFASGKNGGKVKVLFKAPGGSGSAQEPCIKDLDDEVLAPLKKDHGAATFLTNLPHHVASSVIQGVRGKDHSLGSSWITIKNRISNLNELLRILRPRTTSWARDRTVLGALLTLPREEVDTSKTEPQLVTDILHAIKHLPGTAIYHGEVPMAQYGPWSWCPPTIFDMGRMGTVLIPSDRESVGNSSELSLQGDGIIGGEFSVYQLQPSEVGDLLPYSTHPSMEARIRNVFLDFAGGSGRCPSLLIMQVKGQARVLQRQVDVWLLAIPTDISVRRRSGKSNNDWSLFRPKSQWRCRWVGCVYDGSKTRKGAFYGDRFVTFGEDILDDDQGSPAPAMMLPDEVIVSTADNPREHKL